MTTTMTTHELQTLLKTGPIPRLLDVRTASEFQNRHIRGAYNVPLNLLAEHAGEIRSETRPLVLICQSGGRANQALSLLRERDDMNLSVLEGGMNSWVADGGSVISIKSRISLERQVRIVAGGLAALGGILALAVDPLFALLPALIGSGLVFAGITDTCGLALVLSKLPYNRAASCDVLSAVRALSDAKGV